MSLSNDFLSVSTGFEAMLLRNYSPRSLKYIEEMDSYIVRLLIFPSLLINDSKNPNLKWRNRIFEASIFLGIIGAIRCFALASSTAYSRLAYYMADFGAAFGDAHDHAWIMAGNFMLAGTSSAYFSYKYHRENRRDWTDFFWVLSSTSRKTGKRVPIESHGIEKSKMKRLKKFVRCNLRHGIEASLLSGFLYECLEIGAFSTFMPYSYTFTWGVHQMIHAFIVVYFTTANCLIGQVLKAEICVYLVWKWNVLVRTMRKSLRQEFNDDSPIIFIEKYVAHRKEMFIQNEYWKMVGGSAYIFVFIGLLFNLYIQFFIPINIFMRLGMAFWGIGAFLVIIVLQSLVGNHLRRITRKLCPIFHGLAFKTSSIHLKLKAQNMMGDSAWIQPFTCLDIFPFNSYLLLLFLVELSMQLMLLVALNNNNKS